MRGFAFGGEIMKKLIGLEAEINITTDDEVAKGVGHGLKNGTIVLAEIIEKLKPAITEGIRKAILKTDVGKPESENKKV